MKEGEGDAVGGAELFGWSRSGLPNRLQRSTGSGRPPLHARVEDRRPGGQRHEADGKHPGQWPGGGEVITCPQRGDRDEGEHEALDLQEDLHA